MSVDATSQKSSIFNTRNSLLLGYGYLSWTSAGQRSIKRWTSFSVTSSLPLASHFWWLALPFNPPFLSTIYHFQLVTWRAWLASNSHQVALTGLQHYLRSHRIVIYVRVIGMTVVFILLFVPIIYSGPTASGIRSVLQYFDTKVQDT
jgi:hypothetical protein